VQDHLKAIFDKTGVSSRRQLVVTILQEQYLPRALGGARLAPSGFFASPGARPADEAGPGRGGRARRLSD
jgi:hypothetical protein